MKKYIYVLFVVIILGVIGLGCVPESYISPNSLKIQTLERDLARMQGDMEFYRALQYNMINRVIDLEVKVELLENKLKQRDGK